MLLTDVLVYAGNAALEDREVVFDRTLVFVKVKNDSPPDFKYQNALKPLEITYFL